MMEDEKQLVERAQDGEGDAFGSLYDYYLPKIYRFVLLKVSHREEAEDLTHLAFLRAWENIDDYVFEGFSFGSWLYRIARNLVIDHYRSVSRSGNEVQIEDYIEEIASADTPIDIDVDRKMDWAKVLTAMKELTDTERDIIIMRFVDDLPHEEVAKVIGKSVGATKLAQHRAIKRLQTKLKHHTAG